MGENSFTPEQDADRTPIAQGSTVETEQTPEQIEIEDILRGAEQLKGNLDNFQSRLEGEGLEKLKEINYTILRINEFLEGQTRAFPLAEDEFREKYGSK